MFSIRIRCISTLLILSSHPFLRATDGDVQAQLAKMSLEEKIGQICVVPVVDDETRQKDFMDSSPYTMDHKYVEQLVQKHHVGGIIFLGNKAQKDDLTQTAKMLQKTQTSSHPDNPKLFVALDAEWGANMRVTDIPVLPRAMTLGSLSTKNESLIATMGLTVAQQCRKLGVHMNLAPVVDINTNPKNPVINTRSFGQDKEAVTRKAMLYLIGMQNGGLLTCLKHFPGHGDTNQDSHETLPKVKRTKAKLQKTELYPYKEFIQSGKAEAIMTAHIEVPYLEIQENCPASLSHNVLTKLLKEELGFAGTVITDGLGMKGVTKDRTHAEVALAALKAGSDILLCPVDVPAAVEHIKKAIEDDASLRTRLDDAVTKMLKLKAKAFRDIEHPEPVTPFEQLQTQLYDGSIIVLKNDNNLLPLDSSPNSWVAEGNSSDSWHETLGELPKPKEPSLMKNLGNVLGLTNTSSEKVILCSLHGLTKDGEVTLMDNSVPDHPVVTTAPAEETVKQLKQAKEDGYKVIVVAFGSPYGIDKFKDADAILLCCENSEPAQQAALRVLTGKVTPSGQLPVDTESFKMGTSVKYAGA